MKTSKPKKVKAKAPIVGAVEVIPEVIEVTKPKASQVRIDADKPLEIGLK